MTISMYTIIFSDLELISAIVLNLEIYIWQKFTLPKKTQGLGKHLRTQWKKIAKAKKPKSKSQTANYYTKFKWGNERGYLFGCHRGTGSVERTIDSIKNFVLTNAAKKEHKSLELMVDKA